MNATARTHTHETPANLAANPDTAEEGTLNKIGLIIETMRARKISMTALQAVIYLYQDTDGHTSLSSLARNLGVTTAAVTSIADSMERLGFARRRINPLDRRLTWINLTPRGIAFAEWLDKTPNSSSEMDYREAATAGV